MNEQKNTTTSKKLADKKKIQTLSYIEQVFWETGHIPTNDVVASTLGYKKSFVESCWKDDTFKTALAARGIDFNPEISKEVLNPQQVVLANMILNTHDKTSIRQKLEMVGVSSQQYHAWLREPAFQNYLRKRAETQFAGADHAAYTGLIKAVENNDFNAIKFFFEMRGIYNPKLDVNINIEVVVMQLIEVVAKYVSPEILAKIAEEIEKIATESTAKVGAIAKPIVEAASQESTNEGAQF